MSKKRRILVSVLVLVLLLSSNMNVFAWSSNEGYGTHEYLLRNSSSWSKFNSTEQALLIAAVNAADNGQYNHSSGGTIHGANNYIKNLRFLYTVAYRMNNLGGNGSNWNQAVIDARNELLSYGTTDIDPNIISDINTLMNSNIMAGGESTIRLRSIKVLGFALHLAGDMYAHQVMVPEQSINEFKAQNAGLSSTTINNLKARINQGTLRFKDIKNVDGVLKASQFEDNASFFSARYSNAAQYSVNKLLSYYTGNKEWGLSIALPWTQASGCRLTFQNQNGQAASVDMKMNALSGNIMGAGYSSDYVSRKFGFDPNLLTGHKN